MKMSIFMPAVPADITVNHYWTCKIVTIKYNYKRHKKISRLFEILKDSPNIETNNYCGFFMLTLAAIAMLHECGDLPSFQFQKTDFNTISAISLCF